MLNQTVPRGQGCLIYVWQLDIEMLQIGKNLLVLRGVGRGFPHHVELRDGRKNAYTTVGYIERAGVMLGVELEFCADLEFAKQ